MNTATVNTTTAVKRVSTHRPPFVLISNNIRYFLKEDEHGFASKQEGKIRLGEITDIDHHNVYKLFMQRGAYFIYMSKVVVFSRNKC